MAKIHYFETNLWKRSHAVWAVLSARIGFNWMDVSWTKDNCTLNLDSTLLAFVPFVAEKTTKERGAQPCVGKSCVRVCRIWISNVLSLCDFLQFHQLSSWFTRASVLYFLQFFVLFYFTLALLSACQKQHQHLVWRKEALRETFVGLLSVSWIKLLSSSWGH